MKLQTALFDGLSDKFGTGSVQQILTVGEEPPCGMRVMLLIQGRRRLFVAGVSEKVGHGEISIVEVDTCDEETPVERADGVRRKVGDVIAEVMANRPE